MSKQISSIDYQRLRYINMLMDGLYANLADIYECIVDREIDEAQIEITKTIEELKRLHESMEDEL